MNERNLKIYEMRLGGATFSSIAKEFGLSGARVRYICRKIERMKSRNSDEFCTTLFPDLMPKNGQRLLTALRRSGIDTIEKLLIKTKSDILRLRNIGKDSCALLEDRLKELGLKLADEEYDDF